MRRAPPGARGIALAALVTGAAACAGPPREAERADGDVPPFIALDSVAPDTTWTVGILSRPASAAGIAQVVAVRAARQEGYDRVVWEFEGSGHPGVHLEYVDRPVRQCGSGEPVPLAGDGWLEVRFEPARGHDEEGRATAGEAELAPALPVVREVERTCDFEAVATWVLGVARPNRYRVLALVDPARIAVDVRH